MASLGRVVGAIRQRGGLGAFYAGFVPNALKNLPNKGVHLSAVLHCGLPLMWLMPCWMNAQPGHIIWNSS